MFAVLEKEHVPFVVKKFSGHMRNSACGAVTFPLWKWSGLCSSSSMYHLICLFRFFTSINRYGSSSQTARVYSYQWQVFHKEMGASKQQDLGGFQGILCGIHFISSLCFELTLLTDVSRCI